MMESTGKDPFYTPGLFFSCIRCSACCRHESGYVFLSVKDLSLLCVALNMDPKDFAQAYCRWIPSMGGNYQLSLIEKSNYDCVFWEEGGCSVYESRPLQCRAFPFWRSVVSSRRSWEMTARDCPGLGRGDLHSRETIEKWLALRNEEPVIERIENKGES